MKITIQLIIDHQDGSESETHEAHVIRRDGITPATAGLQLAEAHQALTILQRHLVAAQPEAAAQAVSIETEALRRRTQGRAPTSAQLVIIAGRFEALANNLARSGQVGHPVTLCLLDEARALTRTSGGAIGSGQGSNSGV
ncbi:hypothetical protein ABZ769_11170 [Streptomyces olivoreticuli]